MESDLGKISSVENKTSLLENDIDAKIEENSHENCKILSKHSKHIAEENNSKLCIIKYF